MQEKDTARSTDLVEGHLDQRNFKLASSAKHVGSDGNLFMVGVAAGVGAHKPPRKGM